MDPNLRDPLEQLGILVRLGRVYPPGLTDRMMGGVYGYGHYLRTWRKGAVMELTGYRVNGSLLHLEHRVTHEAKSEANERMKRDEVALASGKASYLGEHFNAV